jgi:hypothetical protein
MRVSGPVTQESLRLARGSSVGFRRACAPIRVLRGNCHHAIIHQGFLGAIGG